MVPQGVLVTSVYQGYGADKAGIRTGDVITSGGGVSFAGKTSEFCVNKLKGPAGTKVQVTVERGSQSLSFTLERMQIILPLIGSRVLENHIGYIAIYSFGEDTAVQFGESVKNLKNKGVDCWIIDLRNNGGGYIQAALDLLGYFIGDKTAVIAADRSPIKLAYTATAPGHCFGRYGHSPDQCILRQRLGDYGRRLKDYGKVTIVGERTYGSGRVKALIPLSNGDVLKLPVQRFYSPYQNPIDKVGIPPDIGLDGSDELETALLLLRSLNSEAAKSETGDKTGYLRLNAGRQFPLAIADLRKAEFWKYGKKILDTAYVTTTPQLGGPDGWEPFPEYCLTDRSKIYYPGYAESGRLKNIPLDKVFTVAFHQDMDWKTVSRGSIELIDASSGERVDCEFHLSISKA
jgi:carboxyl-terminal processing protease